MSNRQILVTKINSEMKKVADWLANSLSKNCDKSKLMFKHNNNDIDHVNEFNFFQPNYKQ